MWIIHSQHSMKKLYSLLEETWLTKQQAKTFICIYQYWPKPASTIAKIINGERTNVYKTIQKLITKWLVAETSKQWIKQFFVPNKNTIRHSIEEEQARLDKKTQLLPLIENELQKMNQERISPIPKMRFFEWKQWLQNLFDDMYTVIVEKKYLMIKCIASNTLESQSHSNLLLKDYASDFLAKIEKEKIHIQSYIGNGILTLEHIIKSYDKEILSWLPAWNEAINVYIVWDTIYLIIFKNIPFGLKIQSEAFADLMHFLLKQIK